MSAVEQLQNVPDDRFVAMYENLTHQGFGPLDAEVAQALKFRPQAIRKVPIAKRAKKARELILARKNEELAYEFIGAYLMKIDKELVTDFLDKTGVPHEDGMIEDLDDLPADDKLDTAIQELDAAHEAENVTMYLALAAQQWPEVPRLGDIWRQRIDG